MMSILFTLFIYFTQLQAIPLGYGDVIQGEFTQNQTDYQYQFDGRVGDVVLIDMLVPINTRLDASLRLTLPNGEVVIASEASGTAAHLGPLTLTKDGQYQIDVTAFAGAGPFTLQLTNIEELAPIAFDKPLEIALDGGLPLVYLRFDNEDFDMLHLEARQTDSPGTRPNLRVFDLAGNSISDGAYFRETGIDPLPATPNTTYIIALQQNLPESAATRHYEVSIAPSEVMLLTPGEAVQGNLGDVQFFAAEAGQRIRVHFLMLDDAPSPDLTIRSINDAHFLIFATGDALTEFSATLTIPAAMLYAIEITDASFSGARGSYMLWIEEGESSEDLESPKG
jgi:hypothetical protein